MFAQGECLYEQELLPYREDTEKRGKAAKIPTKSTNKKPKSPGVTWSELLDIGDEMEEMSVDAPPTDAGEKPALDPSDDFQRPPSRDSGDDCMIINVETLRDPVEDSPKLVANDDDEEEVELQGMFYLPLWESSRRTDKPGKDETLKVILANVAELLRRSPPPLVDISDAELIPPPPQPLHQPFFVSFSLDVDDDDDDEMICATQKKALALKESEENPAGVSAGSPTWDEVFEDEVVGVDNEEQERLRARGNEEVERRSKEVADGASQTDESMELFEDDEAFLQMTIPDIPTPLKDSTNKTAATVEYDLHMQNTTNSCRTSPLPESTNDAASTEQRTDNNKSFSMQETPKPLKTSNHLFSVNFDLGFSLESSEDEADAPASPPPKKQASLPGVSDSSTPHSGLSRLCSESRSSKPQITSGREALLSPITPTGPQQTLQSGSLKRRRLNVIDSPPKPGLIRSF